MRSLYFLVPGTTGQFACGGLWAELKTLALAKNLCEATLVTYQQREPDTLFLPDVLRRDDLDNVIFVVSWGFHVARLVKKLHHCNVVYHAHSAGYGFRLPADIPIIAVSRNTMSYWGQHAPNALIYYLPNYISESFRNENRPRDIEVLLQTRKSSAYLLKQLVPALRQHCQVTVVETYIEDIVGLFNRSQVYLYDSAEYWAQQRVSEGFGLPPMEALACGCQVFSSVNGALADYLDPGFNCHKIAGYSTAYDVARILDVLRSPVNRTLPDSFFKEYRQHNLLKRLQVILAELNLFFDHRRSQPSDIPSLTRWRLAQLFMQRLHKKLNQVLQSG
ncbi:glycosyltransferase [Almyronema epifaneia]|uniref:Glycosyltransferase n=1 Tax=Almyronema epifaneia S1 TaxID=2991925 RepID=A0ABW6IG74_9CYAN